MLTPHPTVVAVWQYYYAHKSVYLRRYAQLYLTDEQLLPWWNENNLPWDNDHTRPKRFGGFVGLACYLPGCGEEEKEPDPNAPVDIIVG